MPDPEALTFRLSPLDKTKLLEQLLQTEQYEGGDSTDHVNAVVANPPLVLAIFLEREAPQTSANPHQSILRGTLNKLISAITYWGQVDPHLLHVELVLVSPHGDFFNFATYLGDHARWREGNDPYYLEGEWRALPIDASQAVAALASECDRSVGTPYSVMRYIFASPVLGWLSAQLRDRAGDPAHCASLTARLLHHAFGAHGKKLMPQHSASYSPSGLYNAICDHATSIRLGEQSVYSESIPCDLVSSSDDVLSKFRPSERAATILTMAHCVRNRLVADGRAINPAWTRDLAWAALRCGAVSNRLDRI